MSQTLSLEPGKYALFIVPPVAGVDYTGTPLPTVSYQWKKNGTAIAGQTNATISGVWVEQSGGTVDLVDGDVISIDIILTNLVSVATKTIAATIDSAIPAPVISPVSIRQLSGGTYQTVTSLANTDIGEQLLVASNTGGTVTTTPPVLTTYQWRRGYGAIAGATAQTYTLQAADADSIIDCVVTATNSGGTTTATATVVVGTVADAGGWTELTPSADSRLIYVSNAGTDAAAATVKGRGYYLPSDEEIGPDPTNPVGPIVAYQTFAAAKSYMRNQQPDWMLFRRGGEYAIGGLLNNAFGEGGRANSDRRVYTAWGPVIENRPVLTDARVRLWGNDGGNYMTVASLYLIRSGFNCEYGSRDVTLEDCVFEGSDSANGLQFRPDNIVVRRCVITNNVKRGAGHVHGLYVYTTGSVTIEECVIDRNGFLEDPQDATQWTGGLVGNNRRGFMPQGTGVQPGRTYFDRNLYLSAYGSLHLRGCIVCRDPGGTSVQIRAGGIAERNLFMWNETAISAAHPQMDPALHLGCLIKDNVVLHDDNMLPSGAFGGGITGGGTDNTLAVVESNVVAHFHRGTSDQARSLGLNGKSYYDAAWGASRLSRGIVANNAVYREYGGIGIRVMSAVPTNGVTEADVNNNAIATTGTSSVNENAARLEGSDYGANKYWSDGDSFQWGTTVGSFAQWQAAGYDTDGTLANDFAAFKTAVGWTAPERDIVSYMQSVDPTYVVNEDVHVDEESSVKQAVRQKVWEVLSDPAKAGNHVMSTERAKQVARRYHAFITFIGRAKANRKGAWDTRWTAEAVNNYIREGFGKAPVTGPYDNRDIATRLSEYAS